MNNKIDICALQEKIERCKNMKISDVDINDVDELTQIRINRKKSSNERMLDFLVSTKNPYIFKVNGILVRFIFSDSDKTADDCLTNVLKNLYR